MLRRVLGIFLCAVVIFAGAQSVGAISLGQNLDQKSVVSSNLGSSQKTISICSAKRANLLDSDNSFKSVLVKLLKAFISIGTLWATIKLISIYCGEYLNQIGELSIEALKAIIEASRA